MRKSRCWPTPSALLQPAVRGARVFGTLLLGTLLLGNLALATLVVALLTLGALTIGPVVSAQSSASHGRLSRVVGPLYLEGPAATEAQLDLLADAAARILPRLQDDLGIEPAAPFLLVLLPPDLGGDQELAALNASAPATASGFLHPEQRIGALRLAMVKTYPYNDVEEVLAHEISHMLIWDSLAGSPQQATLPRWLSEGIATWAGRRRGLRDFVTQSSLAFAGEIPTLDQVDRMFHRTPTLTRRAYSVSFDFVARTAHRNDHQVFARLLDRLREEPLEGAWHDVTGETLADAEASFRRRSVWLYRWLPLVSGSGTLWIAISSLGVIAGMSKRRRIRRQLEVWALEEEAAQLREARIVSPDSDSDRNESSIGSGAELWIGGLLEDPDDSDDEPETVH